MLVEHHGKLAPARHHQLGKRNDLGRFFLPGKLRPGLFILLDGEIRYGAQLLFLPGLERELEGEPIADRPHHGSDVALYGEEDSDHVGLDCSRLREQFQTVHHRHPVIRNQHVKARALQLPHRILAVDGGCDLVVVAAESMQERLQNDGIVIDYQDAVGGCGQCAMSRILGFERHRISIISP